MQKKNEETSGSVGIPELNDEIYEKHSKLEESFEVPHICNPLKIMRVLFI